MIIAVLAIYMVIVAVLVQKYHTWTPLNVFKVAIFVLPIITTILALTLTIIAGKLTRTNVDKIQDTLTLASDLIEDVLKNEA